jgi:flagellar biosynthetic protein FlhB
MNGDRTEAPTARRRKKAREEGRVARSAELVGAAVLFGFLWALPLLGPWLCLQETRFWNRTVTDAVRGAAETAPLGDLAGRCLRQMAVMAGPVLGLVSGGALLSNLAQVGIRFNGGLLQPRFSRLDPVSGFRRLVTTRAAVELMKGAVKLALVAGSGWQYFVGHRDRLFELIVTSPVLIGPRTGALAYQMCLRMAATLAVLAALDYAYQRWQHERSLRMTRQEVKDELRESEGNPEIKARIRQRQREIARRRMFAAVPTASLVITNPTHFAVALKYELGQKGAPKVVARGQDLIALRIREVAAAHGVPTIENAPLARSLYQSVDIGQEIPPALYRAVAEVLAVLWRVGGDRGVAAGDIGRSRRPA